MKKFQNLIIMVAVCAGAALLYQKLSSMGPEFEAELAPPSQTETAPTETKPAAPETPAQPAHVIPAPAAAETPATTPPAAAAPAAPATPAPSTQPAAQSATAATPTQSPAPVAPTQPAPTVAAAPPPTPAAAKPVVAASAIPAPASTMPAPAAVTPPPQPVAQPPVHVATAQPPPAPAPVAPQEPQKKLTELTPDDWVARLPVTARSAYKAARSSAETRGDMLGMRSWLSIWRRYLADPAKALIELDMARLLVQNKGEFRSDALAKVAKRENLTEARMLIGGIRSRRINSAELSDMVDKAAQDIDRELAQLK